MKAFRKQCICPFVAVTFLSLFGCMQLTGCVSDEVDNDQPVLTAYQESLIEKAPQQRTQQEGIQSLKPAADPAMPPLKIVSDPNNELDQIQLSIEEAVMRVLANSPEISVVSFEPSIAKEEVTQAVSVFDPALFGQANYEDEDDPANSTTLGGQSNSRLWEAGIKQRGTTGAEWSLGYTLTRNWDDLTTTVLSTRYEPIATFQIRQPLLRDAWEKVNLAGVDIAKLNYKIALASFRQQTEAVSTEVISLYWALKQIRTDRQIQQELLEKTQETLERVQDRKDIDASLAQIKQAETSLKRRLAFLYDIEKQVTDVQDQLVRLLADSQTNLLDDYEIVPTTELVTQKTVFDQPGLLRTAMQQNPAILRSNLAVEIAQINVDVAKQQKMPKLDLVASTRFSGLDNSYRDAQEILYDGDYNSYAVGLTLEIPLGNRQREAEYRKRLLERSKAASGRWNLSDQVAVAVKEAIRSAETRFEQIQIQQEAVLAATTYLQGLEDTEQIRQQLTPEFLLVKLQAQEALAEAARGEIKAIADYNIALARLTQATGTVLDMRYVKNVLPEITKADLQKDSVN
ncbi:MAG: TolC family protein [Phycisphaerae bacterium]|nr:TolC family protein [Phycisphaerae bacterium]